MTERVGNGTAEVDVKRDLNLQGVEGTGYAEILDRPAASMEEAAEILARDGIVVLADECEIFVYDHDGEIVTTTLGEYAEAVRSDTVDRLSEIWGLPDGQEIIAPKHFEAYNDTGRYMSTLSLAEVTEHLPSVISHQHNLLPTVRHITGDPTVDVSTDPDEGTVINLQIFKTDADESTRQEHGAHTDRVDITSIICLDNVGAYGEFVYLAGYNDACRELGLSMHRDFAKNLNQILEQTPQSVVFRIVPIKKGSLALIHSAEDVHFITAKTMGDVNAGIAEGYAPNVFTDIEGEQVYLGRGVINAAFESQACRELAERAASIVERYNLGGLKNDALFDGINSALSQELASGVSKLADNEVDAIYGAIVAKASAYDLYQADAQ